MPVLAAIADVPVAGLAHGPSVNGGIGSEGALHLGEQRQEQEGGRPSKPERGNGLVSDSLVAKDALDDGGAARIAPAPPGRTGCGEENRRFCLSNG